MCCSWVFNIEKRQKESVPIHLFPKRGDSGQRWIKAFANAYMSRVEYLQLVERQCNLFVINILMNNITNNREIAPFFQSAVFFNFEIKISLSTSVFIFYTIPKILETKFYVLHTQTCGNLKQ